MIKRMERMGDGCASWSRAPNAFAWLNGSRKIRTCARWSRFCPSHASSIRKRLKRQAKRAADDSGGVGAAAGCSAGSANRDAGLGRAGPARVFSRFNLNLGVEEEQKMLEADTADELLRVGPQRISRASWRSFNCARRLLRKRRSEMDKAQRDYVLRQQMRAIQKELGEDEAANSRSAVAARASGKSRTAG
jgi:hypothetical protein